MDNFGLHLPPRSVGVLEDLNGKRIKTDKNRFRRGLAVTTFIYY
jgi:hypothetical protein